MYNVAKLHLREGPADYRVPYRNSVLELEYPDLRLGILATSTEPVDRAAMEYMLAHDYKGLSLDFGTGAKKKGQFIVTDQQVAHRFWDTPEQAMAYGSNLLSTCADSPHRGPMIVKVVEDGEAGTGDCHAKLCSIWASMALGIASQAAQFRLIAGDYLAKGTALTYSSPILLEDADLIIPLSAFKSAKKPAPGTYEWEDVTWGTVSRSKVLKVKVGYQVLQWFTPQAIQQDIMPHVEEQISLLLEAGRSAKVATALLNLDGVEAEFNLLQVIRADKFDRLRGHPWIVRGLTQMLRRRWMHLALGAGLHATGLMGVPDDDLPNGVVCSPDLKEGPVIAFRYPVRSWADIKLWDVDTSQHQEHKGVVWMNHKTAGSILGDFDGDYYCFLSAAQFPTLATEIRQWQETRQPPPSVSQKVGNQAYTRRASPWEDMPRVAMDQTNNPLGLTTWLIAAAVASGRLDIADSLVPELQLAVDSWKYDLENDWSVIREAGQEVKPPVWLKDRNSREAFIGRPLKADNAADSISLIARQVAQAWEPPKLRCRPLKEFLPLFPHCTRHGQGARRSNQRWGKRIAEAIKEGNLDEVMPELLTILHDWAEGIKDKDGWAAALWHAAHSSQHPQATASLPFHAFPQVVAEKLQGPAQAPDVITVVGLKYHEWADDLASLSGATEIVTILETVFDDKIRSIARIAGRVVGLVSSETPCPPGLYARYLVWNESGCVFATA